MGDPAARRGHGPVSPKERLLLTKEEMKDAPVIAAAIGRGVPLDELRQCLRALETPVSYTHLDVYKRQASKDPQTNSTPATK